MNEATFPYRRRLLAGAAALRGANWSRWLAENSVAAWLVGGAVRDLALGAAPRDVDLALPRGHSLPTGERLASAIGGRFVVLHEAFGVGRVVEADGQWLDLTDVQGETIEDDLRRRDLTINAIALDWPRGEALLDPTDGLEDLAAGVARRAAPGALLADPVRALRLFRFAAALSLTVDPASLEEATQAAPLLASAPGERVWEELRALLGEERCAPWLARLDECGLIDALLPALAAGAGVAQPDFHHLDVRDHAFEAARLVDELVDEPFFAEVLRAPKSRAILRLAALLHDVGKPPAVDDGEGRRRFPGHSTLGARLAADAAARLRLSNTERRRLTALVEAHMRPHQLGELLAANRLTKRARRKFLLDLRADWRLCLALARVDLRATAGPRAPREGERQAAELAELLAADVATRLAAATQPLVAGDDLLALGAPAGPRVGEILEELSEARFANPAMTRAEALALAKELAARGAKREARDE
jgi:poly(A) polymerase